MTADAVIQFLLALGTGALGFLIGFIVELFLGPAVAVLLPFFLSSNRELNPFWLGYIIGVGVAWLVEPSIIMRAFIKEFERISEKIYRRPVWGS